MNPPEITPTAPTQLPTATAGKNEQTMGMLCHLTALSKYLMIPFGHILGPLIVWMIKREQMPFVDQEGKESLNFQISVSLYSLVCIALCFVLIGFFLLPILLIADLILVILASIEAANGRHFRYPLTIRFIQ